ncbi:nodulation protein NfeD [Parvularcula marina]|uniref:NfeD family protein n=2 Tax=Parvularcula marina TaxID=2292771 RepID=UPI00351919AE
MHGMTKPYRRSPFWAALALLGLILFTLQGIFGAIAQNDAQSRGTILTLDGPVTPASADYLVREIGAASSRGEELVIMEIDTPGGLVTSMKDIIQAILASETPVVTYVSPQGAQSASAGLYIMYSAHVSAMAPATNTGSATPIEIGGTGGGESPFEEPAVPSSDPDEDEANGFGEESEPSSQPVDISNEASMRGKIIEDSVAYIRSLAELRGRNADWAEKAVRPPSASVTANEALELGVIDIVAEDLEDLLAQLDGRTVTVASGETTISTGDVVLTRVEPTLFERILGFLADPNVAAILLTLGTTGIIAELWNPGSILPGTVGIVCLLLALAAFRVLPYDGLFLALMGVGAFLVFIEFFTPTFGLAGATGIGLFTVGLWFLFPGEFRVAPAVLIGTVGSAAVVLGLSIFALAGSRSHGPLIGQEAIRKRTGRVDEWDPKTGEGHVIVDGERWRARSKDPLKEGDAIKVQDVDGIVLVVKKNSASQNGVSRFMPRRGQPETN